MIFGRGDQTLLVVLLAAALLAVIAFNYLTCLFTALRNMRLVSGMELAASLIFAVLGIALMCLWQLQHRERRGGLRRGLPADLAGGAVVAAAGVAAAARVARPACRNGQLWSRVLPFTAWLMVINLLTSLFDLADRQMIIHCSAGDALAEVGNYRSSRVVPLLLASVTAMIAAVATPHLSCDWEAGRRGRVSAQMNLLLKVLAVGLDRRRRADAGRRAAAVPGRLPRQICRRPGRHALDLDLLHLVRPDHRGPEVPLVRRAGGPGGRGPGGRPGRQRGA